MKFCVAFIASVVWTVASTSASADRKMPVIDIPGTSSTCCIGEFNLGLGSTSYYAQSFVALGKTIRSFDFYVLDNFSEINNGPFRFQILLVQGEPNATGTRNILFESEPVSVPHVENGGLFSLIDVDMSCARLRVGEKYTWVIDTYGTRDGVLDVGQVFTTAFDNSIYSDGQWFSLAASGNGREADLAATWTSIPGDLAFHMAFFNEQDFALPSVVDSSQIYVVGGSCRLH